ncbi:MAG: inovirus Gp2 family protein [Cellvibrionaceae bacterium]
MNIQIQTKKPLRKLKANKNLTLSRFRNHKTTVDGKEKYLPVVNNRGPLCVEYLDKVKTTFDRALEEHPNTTVVMALLRFPREMSDDDIQLLGSDVISRFWASLKAQMGPYIFKLEDCYEWSNLRYAWCMEGEKQSWRVHYHVALLVNYDVFKSLGNYGSNQGCLAGLVNEAWARALKRPYEEVSGAVSFPSRPVHYIKTDETGNRKGYEEAFRRVSYLTKSATKNFGNHRRHFDCSRG